MLSLVENLKDKFNEKFDQIEMQLDQINSKLDQLQLGLRAWSDQYMPKQQDTTRKRQHGEPKDNSSNKNETPDPDEPLAKK